MSDRPAPDALDCPRRTWSAGVRTWGGSAPGYAQGAYFPGDRPGWRCELTGDDCEPVLDRCPRFVRLRTPCPDCLQDDLHQPLYRDAVTGRLHCPECHGN